jgi:hypothetical protein
MTREGPNSVGVHKYLPYLAHQDGYQRLRVTSGSEIPWALHRYIQTEMDFLDISSLGDAYRYVVKIEKKFRHQNKWELGSANPQQPKYDKDDPNK